MAETEYRLTTKDNPYNPFTQFDQWFMYDVEKGYNTCGYLARILNEEDNTQDEINEAIDNIIRNDFMNIYIKIKSSKYN